VTPCRQSEPAAIVSASVAILVFASRASSTFAARSAFFFSRCWATSGVSASSRVRSPSRSPTACASSIALVTFFTAARASSGETVPAWTRFSSRSTSNARASYRRV
jgi:hypothetical protein